MRFPVWCVLAGVVVVAAGCGSQTVRDFGAADAAASSDVSAHAEVGDGARADDAGPDDVVRIADVGAPEDVAQRAPAGETCEDAIPVAVGASVHVVAPTPQEVPTLRVTGDNILAGAFPTRWYRVTVPPRVRLEARVETPGDAYYGLHGFTRCDAAAYEARSFAQSDSHAAVLVWPNATALPVTLLLALVRGSPVLGDATLSLSAVPIAPNGFCDSPRRVADGTVLPAQDFAFAGERAGFCAPPTDPLAMRPALYFSAHVNTGETLFASARGRGLGRPPFIGWLNVREGCGDTACLAESTWGINYGQRVGLAWTNDGAPRDVVLSSMVVDPHAEQAPTFTFRVAARAANTRCDAAAPLVPGVAQDVNLASAPTSELPCVPGTQRQAAYYTVMVAARSTLAVHADAVEGLNDGVAVQVIDGCAPVRCLAYAEAQPDMEATATWINDGEARWVGVAVTGALPNGRARTLARVTARVTP